MHYTLNVLYHGLCKCLDIVGEFIIFKIKLIKHSVSYHLTVCCKIAHVLLEKLFTFNLHIHWV